MALFKRGSDENQWRMRSWTWNGVTFSERKWPSPGDQRSILAEGHCRLFSAWGCVWTWSIPTIWSSNSEHDKPSWEYPIFKETYCEPPNWTSLDRCSTNKSTSSIPRVWSLALRCIHPAFPHNLFIMYAHPPRTHHLPTISSPSSLPFSHFPIFHPTVPLFFGFLSPLGVPPYYHPFLGFSMT